METTRSQRHEHAEEIDDDDDIMMLTMMYRHTQARVLVLAVLVG